MTDIAYKKALMRGLGQNPEDYKKLSAIAGKEEFLAFLRHAAAKPELYTGEINDFANVKEAVFQANFHIHTTNSDGMMSMQDFLDLGAKYADKFAAKNQGQKVYLAITDHDTVNGDKEALELIVQNPEKYKNLRIILGIEVSSMFSSPYLKEPKLVHLLHYCLNPYEFLTDKINKERMQGLYHDIRQALGAASERYKDINEKYHITYSLEDLTKMRPQLKIFPHDCRFTLKDYLQFKFLFSDLVLENKEVMDVLHQAGIKTDDLDFTVPKFMLGKAEKRPYWFNYVDTTKQYLENLLKKHHAEDSLEKLNIVYGKVSPNLEEPLKELEWLVTDPKSPLYIKFDKQPIDFKDIVSEFGRSDYTLSGIAHPAYSFKDEYTNPNKTQLVCDIIESFKRCQGRDEMTIERYYAYSQNVLPQWINLFYTVADTYQYIPTGGRDSHCNNFFSRDKWISKEQLQSLTAHNNVLFDMMQKSKAKNFE